MEVGGGGGAGSIGSRSLEEMDTRKYRAHEETPLLLRDSLACFVLSCAHYFQAPATHGRGL